MMYVSIYKVFFFSSLFSKVLHFDIKFHVVRIFTFYPYVEEVRESHQKNKNKRFLLVDHVPVVKIVILDINKFYIMRGVSLIGRSFFKIRTRNFFRLKKLLS